MSSGRLKEPLTDMVKDLMDLNIGSIYVNAGKVKDEDRKLKYGPIPLINK